MWSFQFKVPLVQNDCVQIEIQNPYIDVSSYSSFTKIGNIGCTVTNQPQAQCTTLKTSTLQIKILDIQQINQTILQGKTLGSLFSNPYSQIQKVNVTVTHLKQCSTNFILNQDTTKLNSILSSLLDSNKISILTSSNKIGVTDATLIVNMKPTTALQPKGQIMVSSPPWYQKQSINQQNVTQDNYSDCMLSNVTTVTIQSQTIVIVDKTIYYPISQVLIVYYTANRLITPADSVTLSYSNFKNPVDNQLVQGFQITTMDIEGNVIDKSFNNLLLSSLVSVPQSLNDAKVQFLGDENGQNIGLISTLQQMQINLSLNAPLQPFCYFKIQFPQNLKIYPQIVQTITGTGIFTPYLNSNTLSAGLYYINETSNTIQIQGCRIPNFLTDKPDGSLTFNLIQMPDYIIDLDPFQISVFTDQSQQNKVVFDSNFAKIKQTQLIPGVFNTVFFQPSSNYAFAKNVNFNIFVIPQHAVTPDTRIIITMPNRLLFDRKQGCQVALQICNCTIDPFNNTLILTNIFNKYTSAGNLIQFKIMNATNPQGAQQAGPWAIRTETLVSGKYYVVDQQSYNQSYFAISGIIKSTLTIDNLQVSSSNTSYKFNLVTQNDIPAKGKLLIVFPPEIPLQDQIQVTGLSDYIQQGNNLTFQIDNFASAGSILQVQILGIQNARSFQPSSSFLIQTTDQIDQIIDIGGQEIIVALTSPALFNSVQIVNLNKTNGAIGTLNVTINIQYPFFNGDILHLEFPSDLILKSNVTCAASIQVQNVTCQNQNQDLQIRINSISQKAIGQFSILVYGVINPINLKPTSPFQAVYSTDAAGYMSQQAQTTSNLMISTSDPAKIQIFTFTQETQVLNQVGYLSLQFQPVNSISNSGLILLSWPESVTILNDSSCNITTYQLLQKQDVCVFNFQNRTLRIQNAFKELTSRFNGTISIYISRVQNPTTNNNTLSFNLATYDESQAIYIMDTLSFLPKLCPYGWISNGTQCQQCDQSCQTCYDSGLSGDVGRCLTCTKGYNFFQPVSGNNGHCLTKCSKGYYDNGNGLCLPCSLNCQSCEKNANNCTTCNQDSNLPVILQNKCLGDCPNNYIDKAGKCEKCQSPCAQCNTSINLCTSCDGINGLKYRFGVNCVNECPLGTQQDNQLNFCSGCKKGCKICDLDYPDTCLKCELGYYTFENQCYVTCPQNTIVNFYGYSCRSLTVIEQRLAYFPFVVIIILMWFLSYNMQKIKPTHLVFTNFVIMLGLIEHIAMITQIVLSFIYGTVGITIPIILIWLGYLGVQIWFNIIWRRDIIAKDYQFEQLSQHSTNILSTRIRNLLGTVVCWKFYKLLYSKCFGVKSNTFLLSNSSDVEKLMLKSTVLNICITYFPLMLLNIIGLAVISKWGNQLTIMQIENLILSVVLIIASIIEQKYIKTYWNSSDIISNKQNQISIKIGGRKCKSDFNDSEDIEEDHNQIWTWPISPDDRDNIIVDNPPIPFSALHFENCYHEASNTLKPLNDQGFNKKCQKGGPFENDLLRADSGIISNLISSDINYLNIGEQKWKSQGKKQRGRKNRFINYIDKQELLRSQENNVEDSNANLLQWSDYLYAIREEDEVQKDVQLVQNEIINSFLENQRQKAHKEAQIIDQLLNQTIHSFIQNSNTHQTTKINLLYQPNANLRNFNEIDVLGKFNRDIDGNVIVVQNSDQQYIDLDGQIVTEQGYLMDEDDVVSVYDPSFKMFKNVIGGVLPAPFSFEKFNFNPFQMYGNFYVYKSKLDPQSFQKISDIQGIFDTKNREVNLQGFLIHEGHLVNQDGKKVFDRLHLKDGQLQQLYNYSGQLFSILDVMGVFYMDDNNQIILNEIQVEGQQQFNDLSGHKVSEQGYLVNMDNDIVNRNGKVIFKQCQLKNGEFPKIFAFSKMYMSWIRGRFKDVNKQLQVQPDGSYQDDNGVKVNKHGYLIDKDGNIVDHNGNIMFEVNLLCDDGDVPALFRNKSLISNKSEEDIANLIQQIELEYNQQDETKLNQIDLLSSADKQIAVSPQTKLVDQNENIKTKSKQENNCKPKSTNQLVQAAKQPQFKMAQQQTETIQSKNESKSKSYRNSLKKLKANFIQIKQILDADVKMAAAYGGDPVARVRMIPKRISTTQGLRQSPKTQRNTQYSNHNKGHNTVQQNGQHKMPITEYNSSVTNIDSKRVQTQLEGKLQANIKRPTSPSNAAFSIKDRIQIKRQFVIAKNELNNEVDFDQEIAELYQQDLDNFIDGSAFEMESLSGCSSLSNESFTSLSRHVLEKSKTKFLEDEYMLKLKEQKQKQKQNMDKTQQFQIDGISDFSHSTLWMAKTLK